MAAATVATAIAGFVIGRPWLGSNEPLRASPAEPPADGQTTSPPAADSADTIDTGKPGWGLPYLEVDKALPRYDQVINGIAAGTPLALPSQLPAGGAGRFPCGALR